MQKNSLNPINQKVPKKIKKKKHNFNPNTNS